MWMFSTDGFISVVAHRDLPNVMMVRARVKADLEQFFGPDRQIEVWPGADYLYRILIDREELAAIVADQVRGIDYWSHAKDEIIKRAPKPDHGSRSKALYATWSAMADLQPYAPYSKTPRPKQVPWSANRVPTAAAGRQPGLFTNPNYVANPGHVAPVAATKSGHYDWTKHPQSATYNGGALDTPPTPVWDDDDQLIGGDDDAITTLGDILADSDDENLPTDEAAWEDLLRRENHRSGPTGGGKRRRGSRGGKKRH